MDSQTSKDAENEEDKKDDDEIKLDSSSMDVNKVLFGHNTRIDLLVPDAKVFNNLSEYYRHTFPKKHEIDVKPKVEIVRNLPAVPAAPTFHDQPFTRKHYSTVLQKMNDAQNGPLSVLHKCLNASLKILIRRKRVANIREEKFSWIEGTLVAFDKHMNLALVGVKEQYSRHLAKVNKTIVINKMIPQLFVRGDNVLLVSNVPSK